MAERVPFDVGNLIDALPAGVDVGTVLAGDWRIADIHWSRDDAIQVRLSRGTGIDIAVLVMPRDESHAAYHRTPHFNIVHLSHKDRDPVRHDLNAKVALKTLASALAFADRGTREWVFPATLPRATYAGTGTPREHVLNLSIESPCASHCSFCSLSVLQPPLPTTDDAYHARLIDELDRARAEGTTRVRINGIDPLTYPRVVEVVAHATALGFVRAELYTTAIPLADEDLVARLLAAMPPERLLSVPLYGASAEVHDAVTGHPGSFERVTAALGHLARLARSSDVIVTSVIMRQNLHDLGNVRALAKRLGFSYRAHLPYPNTGGARDPYRDVAPRVSDAVAALHAMVPPVPVAEAPPCVLLRHERETGLPSLSRISKRQWRAFGRAYRADSYQHSGGRGLVLIAPAVRCPHAESCVLAPACSQELYRAYVELYGTGEFEPPAELTREERAALDGAAS